VQDDDRDWLRQRRSPAAARHVPGRPGSVEGRLHRTAHVRLGGVQAAFAVTAGTIEVVEPTSASSVGLSVDPTFTSDKTRRNTHAKSKALLDVEQYPEISFRSTPSTRTL